ncbi:hypothetical protein R1sor_013094 [Riccia sorocarpa]|uniref:Uncharacterized protein n=1 Tax=Riccia sorocarpa TaxID=122646 RepID=A0ABD3H8U7_9MARC
MQAIELQKAKWAEALLERKWNKDGDRCTKTFFTALKSRKEKIAIQELVNDQGVTLTEEADTAALAQQFFQNLLQKAPVEQGEIQATESILALCKTRLDGVQRAQLEREYTREELYEVACQLGKNKAPGPNSLPLEFFLVSGKRYLKGVHLPQADTWYIQGHLADDTHLMLEAQPTNLSNAKEAIALFGESIGPKSSVE